MDHAGWLEDGIDSARALRLGVGYSVGAASIVGLFLFFSFASEARHEKPVDEAIEVELATLPEPEPEPQAELPPPEPRQDAAVVPEASPNRVTAPPNIDVPDAVPDEPAPEDDASKHRGGEDPYQNGLRGGDGHGTSTSRTKVSSSPRPPPAPPPPPPKGPTLVSEKDTPPRRISCPSPSVSSGLVKEPVVILVRIKISALGAVERAKAMNGPAELRVIAESAVLGCSYRPALDPDGTPKTVLTSTQVPFRVTTGS